MRILVVALLLVATPAAADGLDAAMGKALFGRLWVPAPASTRSADGLGPLHDARACAACHPAGGRAPLTLTEGVPPRPGLVVRLADDPVYGRQLQRLGTATAPAEGEAVAQLAQGRPSVHLRDLAYGPAAAAAGWRAAPSLRGLAELAAVPDAAILAREDPDDRDGDGVRGIAHRLPNGRIGRFGGKATSASVSGQVEAAFAMDLGLSTAARPAWGDCTPTQEACRAAPAGGEPEATDVMLRLVVAYLEQLPARRPAASPPAERLFERVGCAACHSSSVQYSGQAAAARTDLLLHDMGPGLDDGVAEGSAPSGFWRTPPLRDLAVGGLLHDARAPDVASAIGWHAGEAEGARRRFEALSADDRTTLLTWLARL